MFRAENRRARALVSMLCVLAACGSDERPTGPGGGDGGGPTHREVVGDPSFAIEIQELFDRNGCTSSSCHGGGQGGLRLGSDPATNHGNIVNVPAESENFLRVKPFDPDSSYLVIKFEGRQQVGGRMPPEPLDSVDLVNFRTWVVNGALNN